MNTREEVLVQQKERYRSDPEYRRAQCERARARHKLLWGTNPEYREKVRAHLKKIGRGKDNPESVQRRKKGALFRRDAAIGRPKSSTCELCGEKAKTVFDHDHLTGQFRGWLCDRCNRTLGSVKDSTALLMKMVAYITNRGIEKP
jgi:hypothetical protein